MNFISSILHRAARKGGSRVNKLNILTAPTHEAYETNLCETGHNFYAIAGQHIKKWKSEYRPLPSNYFILKNNELPSELSLDCVLSHQKFGQFQALAPIARQYHLPLISLEHTLPIEQWSESKLAQLKGMRGDINLFISDMSKLRWGWNNDEAVTIPHGINTEFFLPNGTRINRMLSVANDYVNRDYFLNFQLFHALAREFPVALIGDNPGLSTAAKSVFELREAYQTSSIFLNTSRWSPIPMSLMEAAACGCAILSTCNCMIPEVFTHGYDAYLSNDYEELRSYARKMLNDEGEARRIGNNARKTIEEKFGLGQFVSNWHNVFDKIMNIAYIGV